MWKGLYFIFYILLQHVQSVKICSTDSSGKQREVDMEMENEKGPCTCDIQLTFNDPLSVTLNFRKTLGIDILCSKFKFVYKKNQILDKTWCGNDADFSIPINTLESSSIRMIVNGTRNSFKFEISTTRQGNLLQVNCHPTPTQSPTETLDHTTTSLTHMIPTASLLSPTTISSQFNTDEHSPITTGTKTRTTITQITTEQDKRNTKDSNDVSYLPIILGCSVGGTVVIILVIVIVGCVLLRRRQATTLSDPENDKRDEMIKTDNNLYFGSDSIPNNNNQHGTNNLAEMEIIPNDLYQSSDSLAHDLNDTEQHEHVPNINTEYAVVKKKPKKIPNTDNGIELTTNPNKVKVDYENIEKEKENLQIEIDRIVGPKGDEYTLVNKFQT